jgi:hypothetical protein
MPGDAVTRNDHYGEAEVLVQPWDTPRGHEALDADSAGGGTGSRHARMADQLAEAVEAMRSLTRVQEERLRYLMSNSTCLT